MGYFSFLGKRNRTFYVNILKKFDLLSSFATSYHRTGSYIVKYNKISCYIIIYI